MSRDGLTAFGIWLLLGGGFAFGFLAILSIGIFVLPVVLILAVLAGRRGVTGRGLLGLVSGAGLPLLYVAWLNRDGPGEVCRRVANGVECTQQSSPWPWLGVGLALVAAGAALFVAVGARRSDARA
jgi:hypothetical protein